MLCNDVACFSVGQSCGISVALPRTGPTSELVRMHLISCQRKRLIRPSH